MVHPAIEPFVRAVRERPPAHPATQTMAQRRSETKILAEALRGNEIAVAEIVDFVLPLEHAEIVARLYVPELSLIHIFGSLQVCSSNQLRRWVP